MCFEAAPIRPLSSVCMGREMPCQNNYSNANSRATFKVVFDFVLMHSERITACTRRHDAASNGSLFDCARIQTLLLALLDERVNLCLSDHIVFGAHHEDRVRKDGRDEGEGDERTASISPRLRALCLLAERLGGGR